VVPHIAHVGLEYCLGAAERVGQRRLSAPLGGRVSVYPRTSTGKGMAHRLGATERLGQRRRAIDALLQLRTCVAHEAQVEQHVSRRLGLARARLAAHNNGLVAPLGDHRAVRRRGDGEDVRRLALEREARFVLR